MTNKPPEGPPPPDQNNLNEEAARRKARDDIIGWIRHGHIDDAIKVARDSALSGPDIHAAAEEGMYQQLSFGYLDDAIKIIAMFKLPPEVIAKPKIQDAALTGMTQRLRMMDIKDALRFIEAFNLSEVEVREKAVWVMIGQLSDIYPLNALQIAKDLKLPPEVMQETELQKAAVASLKKLFLFGKYDDALAVVQGFNLPESEVRAAAMQELISRLSSEYYSSDAHTIAEKFNLPASEVHAIAVAGVVEQISSDRIEKARDIARDFQLTKEEIRVAAPNAKQAAKAKGWKQGGDILAKKLEDAFGPY